MCFFARLGLVQPPCCLPCAFEEAKQQPNSAINCCNNWVVWRRDANLPLHPDTLGDNLVFIRCHAVRRLLAASAKNSSTSADSNWSRAASLTPGSDGCGKWSSSVVWF